MTTYANAAVEHNIEEDPNESIPLQAQHLDMCSSTLLNILLNNLGTRTNKIQLVQKLKLNGHQTRRSLDELAQNKVAIGIDSHTKISLSD